MVRCEEKQGKGVGGVERGEECKGAGGIEGGEECKDLGFRV